MAETAPPAATYDPRVAEPRWQARWEAEGLYRAERDPARPKHYALTMLPYPSGDLHMGHWYAMAPSDARARWMRMRGHNVLFPMGFDAFGLPAENAAIKHGVPPKEWTYRNIERMRGQLRRMGMMVDWRREAISADPEYYRWTQWFFLRLFDGGLAYRKRSPVDWCPGCNTTLAREQVVGEARVCERCETPVTKRDLAQWFLRTTRYADELLRHEGIDWPERVRTLQERWIGRSEGARVEFETEAGEPLEVFTTRPDTLWGVTFMVLAPEHPLVERLTTPAHADAVRAYAEQAARQSDVQREAAGREKTGVWTGGFAVNPVNGERIPVWVADYVLMSYGTGAIMAVPAHDQRDFEFARAFGLPIRPVIVPEGEPPPAPEALEAAVEARGRMVDSGPLTGTPAEAAVERAIAFVEERGAGRRAVTWRLRDWLISRQRYWGAPIPIVHCPSCGPVGVPVAELPVRLPEEVEWRPTGESPLKLHPTWRHRPCPACGEDAERETDTMDTFLCSSWYHLRYLSPRAADAPFDPAEYDYWMPVDTYTGGIEHATMHLIYTRFFHKACRDLGIVRGDEPMRQLRNQGIILGEDSEKMSKSRGNVVAPDALVDRYGTDVVRAYLMFFARWEQGGPWSSQGIQGTWRWLQRVYQLFGAGPDGGPGAPPDAEAVAGLRRRVHQALARVTADFDAFQFNTIISTLMELLNDLVKARDGGLGGTPAWDEALGIYLRMLAPVAPHLAEELWRGPGTPPGRRSIHEEAWPEVDRAAAAEAQLVLAVQVNGKVRDHITVAVGTPEAEIRALALASAGARRSLEGRTPRKVIVVPGRLVNIVA